MKKENIRNNISKIFEHTLVNCSLFVIESFFIINIYNYMLKFNFLQNIFAKIIIFSIVVFGGLFIWLNLYMIYLKNLRILEKEKKWLEKRYN